MKTLRYAALEPRILLDAAAVATVAELANHDTDASHSANSSADASSADNNSQAPDASASIDAGLVPVAASDSGRTLYVVDSRIDGAADLIARLSESANAEVIVVDGETAGASLIADAIAAAGPVSAVHIFSHGSAGVFFLGADRVDTQALSGYTGTELARWSAGLTADADILVYGCDVATDDAGKSFVAALADLTGADVAASDDASGRADLGGDWDLEVTSGDVTQFLPSGAASLHAIAELLDAPTITDSGSGRIIAEDNALSLTGVSVADSDGDTLTVTIHATDTSGTASTGTDTGTVTLASTANLTITAGANGSATVTIQGSAADINAALNGMTYSPTANLNGTSRIAFSVADAGASATLNVAVAISPVNDAPSLTPVTVNASEGGTVTIADTSFGLVDPELGDTQIAEHQVFKLVALPTGGTLLLNGNTLPVGGTFSLAQIQSNLLKYVHNGTDVVVGVNDTDSFQVTINDGAGSGDVGPTTINIAIAQTNQAPTITGGATVFEGQGSEPVHTNGATTTASASIGGTLTISGVDGDPSDAVANLSVTISNVDNGGDGTLFFDADNDGVLDAGEAIAETTGSVTFAGNLLSQLRFIHNGAEPDATNPSFRISVTDGGGGTGVGATTDRTITISVTPNDDNPVLAENNTVAVNAGATIVLQNTDLQVTDADDISGGAHLVYLVTAKPQFGDLKLDGLTLGVGGRFTQADLDAGRVTYVQTATVDDPDDAGAQTVADSFDFQVRDMRLRAFNDAGVEGAIYTAAGAIATNTFNINISGDNTTGTGPGAAAPGHSGTVVVDGPPTNTGMTGASAVTEDDGVVGGIDTGTITAAMLSYTLKSDDGALTIPASETVYRVISLPGNGVLQLNGVTLLQYDVFTQDDINNGRVTFSQNGGETHQSSFAYSVTGGTAESYAGTFDLVTNPANDTPTAAGGTVPVITEGATVRITGAYVSMADVDNQAEAGEPNGEARTDDLFFRVTELPANGTLERWNGSAWIAVTTDDLLSRDLLSASADGGTSGLRYTHNGTENFTDSFKFTVRDDLTETGGDLAIQSQTTAGVAAAGELSNEATVDLTIAPVNDRPISDANPGADSATTVNGRTTVNQVLTVVEGASGTIDENFLVSVDADNTPQTLQYRIVTNVATGKLLLNGKQLGIGSAFTQQDIDNNLLTYQHNGAEVFSDSFTFIVSDSVFDHEQTLGGTVAASQFDIVIQPPDHRNDIPTLTASGTSVDVSGAPASTPVSLNGVFTIGDRDIDDGVITAGAEVDFMQATVILKDSGGAAVDLSGTGSLVIAAGAASNVTITSNDQAGGTLVFQGTLANVRAAINALTVTLPDGDHDATFTVEVTVDDRLRDGAGALTGGGLTANGDIDGTINDNNTPISAANNRVTVSISLLASETNDPPTVTVPAAQSAFEDIAHAIPGLSIGDADSFNKSVTVTLGVTNGTITASGGGATIANSGTATVTLTGTVAQINTTLATISYTGNANFFGADTLTVTVNDNGNIGSDGAKTVTDTVAITVAPLNDAPTLTSTGTPIVVSDSGFFAVSGFSVADLDIDGTYGGIGAGETDFVEVTIRILDASDVPLALATYTANTVKIGSTTPGTATVDTTLNGDSAALQIRGTRAEVNTYLAGLQVDLGSLSNTDSNFEVQVVVDDRVRTNDAAGALDASNDANGGKNPNNADLSLATGAANIATTELDPYSGSLSLPLNVASAMRSIFLSSFNDPADITANNVVADEFFAVINLNTGNANITVADQDDNGGLMSVTVTASSGTFSLIGGAGGTVSGLNTNTLTITGATEAQINSRLQDLTLRFDDPDGAGLTNPAVRTDFNGTITVTVEVNDEGNTGQRPATLTGDTDDASANPGDYSYADGSSNKLVTTRTFTVTINPTNDTPKFNTTTGVTTTVTESTAPNTGTTPVQIVTGADIYDVDLATTAGLDANTFGAGSLTVSVTGAQASEQLTLDLTSLNGGVLPAGMTITSDGSNGTNLVVTFDDDTTLAEVNDVLEGLRYHTTSDTLSGARTISIVLNDGNNVQAGGNAGGPAPLSATLTSTITITEQNDPPVGGDQTLTTPEDTALTLAAANFNFSQPGGETDTLGAVRIDTLPASGTLRLNGVAVSAGTVVTVAQINGGQLTYLPAQDVNGSAVASFTFTVRDNRGALAASANTLTIDVTPRNDAPTLAGTSAEPKLIIKSDGTGTTTSAALVTAVTAADIDILTDADVNSFGGGSLTISFTDGYQPGDRLSVAGGVLAGMAGAATGGSAANLVISLSDDATAAQVKAIIEAVRYASVEADATNAGADPTRAFSIVLNDGNNNNDAGATDGVNDAGGPAALNSNALTGTIAFRLPPTAANDTGTVTKIVPVKTGDVSTNDNDPEHAASPGTEAKFTVTQVAGAGGNVGAGTAGTFGSVVINADGTYTYTLDTTNATVAALMPGDASLTDTFTYQITDNDGQTATATLTITIDPSDSPPTALDNARSIAIGSATSTSGNVVSDNDGSGVDSDPENQALTVVSVAGAAGNVGNGLLGTYGTLTVNANGTYTYVITPGNAAVAALTAGASLTETFAYTISDGTSTDTANLTITITKPVPTPTPAPTPPGPTPTPPPPPTSPPGGGGGGPGPSGGPPGGPPSLAERRADEVRRMVSTYDLRQSLINPVRLAVELQDQVVSEGVQTISLPASAFQHTDPSESISVESTQADGSPLPTYVLFDGQNRTFVIDSDLARSLGVRSVDVRVVGTDTHGNDARTTFTIHFTDNVIETAPDEQAPEPANADPEPGPEPENAPAPDVIDGIPSVNHTVSPGADSEQAAELKGPSDKTLAWTAIDTQAKNYGRHAYLAARDALLADVASMGRHV